MLPQAVTPNDSKAAATNIHGWQRCVFIKSETRNPNIETRNNRCVEIRISKPETNCLRRKLEYRNSKRSFFRFPNDTSEDVHELGRFSGKSVSVLLKLCVITYIYQP